MRSARFFTFNEVELVRIGQGHARILAVTHDRCDYSDEAGSLFYVDFEECARVWVCLDGSIPDPDYDWSTLAVSDPNFYAVDVSGLRTVGLRGAADDPPWFQFFNRRRTQFEFKDYDHIYSELLTPMTRVACNSWDAS